MGIPVLCVQASSYQRVDTSKSLLGLNQQQMGPGEIQTPGGGAGRAGAGDSRDVPFLGLAPTELLGHGDARGK